MIVAPAPRLRLLECEVDTARRVVTRGEGATLRLTVKSMQVLLVLAAQAGRVVSREALFEQVWPATMPTDDVLTQAVTQLRKAFGDDRDAPRYIETIARAGYRLLPEVQWCAEAEPPATAALAAASGPDPAVQAMPSTVPSSPSVPPAPGTEAGRARLRPAIGIARGWATLALLGVVALGGIALWKRLDAPPAAPAAPAPAEVLQAVAYKGLTSNPGQERHPALSPDGATVAFAQFPAEGAERGLMLQGVGQATARRLTSPAEGERDLLPVWSRDGTRIAFVRMDAERCAILLVPATGGEAREAGPCLGRAYSHFDWTPDGRGLVMGGLRGGEASGARLHRLDLASGRWTPLDYGSAEGDVDLLPRYSPDGRWLVFRRNLSLADLWMMPAEGGEPRRLTHLRGDIRGWDWLPDGSGLVFSLVSASAGLSIYRMADGAILPLPPLASGNPVYPDVASRDWSMVFEIDQSRSGLFRVRLDDTRAAPAPEPVFASSGTDVLPAISPDGRVLAFVSDRTMAVRLWLGEVGQPETLRAIEGLVPIARHVPVWSADGRRLLVLGRAGSGDGVFEVDTASGAVRQLQTPEATPVAVAYGAGPDQLLVVVDAGQGRLRLALYAQEARREIASIDDVALARHAPSDNRIWFTRTSAGGLWRANADLGDVTRVSEASPSVQDYRNWAVTAGQLHYFGQGPSCATLWRPLLERTAGTCISPESAAIGGSSVVVDGATWLYLGLPSRQNIDVGWSALPPASTSG